MLTLMWMLVTALGFMLSGILLWTGGWYASGIVFGITTVWFAVPKTASGLLELAGRALLKKQAPAAKAE